MAKVTGIEKGRSYSLKSFAALPRLTTLETLPENINLESKLVLLPETRNKYLTLDVPFIGAPMQALAGYKGRGQLLISLAKEGCIGFVTRNVSEEIQENMIQAVKSAQGGIQTNLRTVSSETTIEELISYIRLTKFSKFPVTKNGEPKGRLLGLITDDMFDPDPKTMGEEYVKDFMRGYILVDNSGKPIKNVGIQNKMDGYFPLAVRKGIDLKQSGSIMARWATGFLLVVDKEGNLQGGIFKKDRDNHFLHHPFESLNEKKKYMVGGSVSTHPRDHSRIERLVREDLDTDVMGIDASHGHTSMQITTLQYIRKRAPGMPVVGGNVVTYDGFMHLMKQSEKYGGFSAIKVGMGVGSGCTTTERVGVGRGQLTALMDVVRARDYYFKTAGKYIPVIADGGVLTGQEMLVALALADTVMMGKFFVRYTESAADIAQNGMKEYWMEGSRRARNIERYDVSNIPFFPQGEEGYVPHIGSIHAEEGLKEAVAALKVAFSEAGCKDIKDLHRYVTLEYRDPESQKEIGASGLQLKTSH